MMTRFDAWGYSSILDFRWCRTLQLELPQRLRYLAFHDGDEEKEVASSGRRRASRPGCIIMKAPSSGGNQLMTRHSDACRRLGHFEMAVFHLCIELAEQESPPIDKESST